MLLVLLLVLLSVCVSHVCNVLLGLLLCVWCATLSIHCYWFGEVALHALKAILVSRMT